MTLLLPDEGCLTWYLPLVSVAPRDSLRNALINTQASPQGFVCALRATRPRTGPRKGIAPLAVESSVHRVVRPGTALLRVRHDARRRVKQTCPRLGRGDRIGEGCGRAGGRYK